MSRIGMQADDAVTSNGTQNGQQRIPHRTSTVVFPSPMRRFGLVLVLLVPCLAGCSSGATADATPTPIPVVSHSREVRKELNELLEKSNKVFHAGCRDEEKGACMDTSRVCPADRKAIGGLAAAAAKKAPVVIEWEEARVTWEKNEGVDSQYWFVKPDGSGLHYYRVAGPTDIAIDCGNGVYCGWHKTEVAAGTLLANNTLTLTPRDAKEPLADISACPEPPPQPDWENR